MEFVKTLVVDTSWQFTFLVLGLLVAMLGASRIKRAQDIAKEKVELDHEWRVDQTRAKMIEQRPSVNGE